MRARITDKANLADARVVEIAHRGVFRADGDEQDDALFDVGLVEVVP